MKRILRRVCTVCLLLVLLSAGTTTVFATGIDGAEKALQFAVYYDPDKEEFIENSMWLCVLMQYDGKNYVATLLAPKDGLILLHCVADDQDTYYGTQYEGSISQSLSLYSARSDFGKAQGFYPVGTVTKGEPLQCVFYNKEGKLTVESTTATEFRDGSLTLTNDPAGYVPMIVLNSKNEICAIIDENGCYPCITDEEGFNGGDQPSPTQPPETKPSEEPSKRVRKAGKLPDLEELLENAKIEKQDSKLSIVAIVGVSILVVGLAVAVVIVKRKNKKISQQGSGIPEEAEEGTQLADDFVDTGLRLQFRDGKRIALRQNITIGRAPDNGVVISNQSTSVSGHHCGILIQGGQVFLRDMGSTNGTFVNGRRIAAGQPVPLQPGMRVSLGSVNSPECFDVVLSSKLTGKP